MNRQSKLASLVIAAVCGLGVLAATAAGADQWYVGNPTASTTLAIGSSRPIKGKSGTSIIKMPSWGANTVCTGDSFTGKLANVSTSSVVEAHIGITGWKLTGCVVKTSSGGSTTCTINSVGQPAGTILFNPLTGKLNTTTGAGKEHFTLEPETGTVFSDTGTVFSDFEVGGGCSFETAEPTPLIGSLEGTQAAPELATIESHTVRYTFPETALSGSALKFGALALTFVTTEEVELETAGETAVLK